MAKKMLIDATHAEETRVVVCDGTKVEDFDFETVNKRQLAGNIYLAKVTRVEPSLQAAFIDYGGNRHGFLAFAEIHPDYYQIPAADRAALIAEERAYAEAQDAEDNARSSRKKKPRGGAPRPAAAETADSGDATTSEEIPGMEVSDLTEDGDDADNAADQTMPTEASDRDDSIESVAEEDMAEEIRSPRKPRARRYKIQEVVKVRQIMLVQVVKEERGNKGAALTTYLSLAGRYCVLMPNTARGGGISRKITNAADRKKLKDIASELEVPKGAGLIIRTAGSQRTRTEIKRDYEYLMRLWEQIRELTFKSTAPAPIYEEGDLIKRSIRDLYSKDIDEVLVEGDRGYRVAKDFMKMIMPSHAKNVKHYGDQMPLFARFQVESYLGGMFNPVVQLKSGGYIVIGVTEALVAIDVNSGRATKEGSIEDTATKTNLEAADEISRQLRLRDLAGLIVIDFIDMDERKNNAAVEKRFKEKLKNDRARIQVGKISGFGLMEMSRQRLRPGMLESTTQPCAHCHGTGLIRSDDSLALTILRQIEEEGTRKRSREVLLRAPVAVANFLMNAKREHIAGIEVRYGLSVRIEADPSLISPDFALEKFKTATRVVPEVSAPVVSVNAQLMAQIDNEDDDVEDEADEDRAEVVEAAEVAEVAEANGTEARGDDARGEDSGEAGGKKRRRRRRRKKSSGDGGDQDVTSQNGAGDDDADEDGDDDAQAAPVQDLTDAPIEDDAKPQAEAEAAAPDAEAAKKPATRSRSRSRSRSKKADAVDAEAEAPAAEADAAATAEPTQAPTMVDLRDAPKPAAKPRRSAKADRDEAPPVEAEAEVAPVPIARDEAPAVQPAHADVDLVPEPDAKPEAASESEPEPEPAMADADPVADDKPARAKRRGWWSSGS